MVLKTNYPRHRDITYEILTRSAGKVHFFENEIYTCASNKITFLFILFSKLL